MWLLQKKFGDTLKVSGPIEMGELGSLDIPGFLFGDSKTRELGQDGLVDLGEGKLVIWWIKIFNQKLRTEECPFFFF